MSGSRRSLRIRVLSIFRRGIIKYLKYIRKKDFRSKRGKMAKVKGYNPPNTELTYEDASGEQHFFGELVRMILGDPFPSLAVDPEDEEDEGE